MKLLISLTFIAAYLAAVCGKRCQYADDCDEGQCCVALSSAQLRTKGICLRLARKGTRCSEPESKNDYYGGKYISFCPCVDGFSCTPYRLKEGETDYIKKLASLRCQAEKVTKEPDNKSTRSDDVTPKPDITVPTVQTEPEPQPETKPEPEPEIPDETPNESEQGPGGEHPRDDDCEDWTYGC